MIRLARAARLTVVMVTATSLAFTLLLAATAAPVAAGTCYGPERVWTVTRLNETVTTYYTPEFYCAGSYQILQATYVRRVSMKAVVPACSGCPSVTHRFRYASVHASFLQNLEASPALWADSTVGGTSCVWNCTITRTYYPGVRVPHDGAGNEAFKVICYCTRTVWDGLFHHYIHQHLHAWNPG